MKVWARAAVPHLLLLLLWLLGASLAGQAHAAEPIASVPGVQLSFDGDAARSETSSALKILMGLTVLSLAPAILMSMTSFIRIVVVLSMLRHAIGMPETPPNTVIVSLALFLTMFTMAPTFERMQAEAVRPYMAGSVSGEAALKQGVAPLREFMVRQTREEDLALMVDLAKAARPASMEDISMIQLIPAFMLSELRAAFQIGFVIFLPFLLIDLIAASALMSLGMMMVPPASIALPLKILVFVLMDGWSLVARALVGTFHG